MIRGRDKLEESHDFLDRESIAVENGPKLRKASWAPCTVNLFGALTNGKLVSLAISPAAASAKPGAELIPVPHCGAAERQSVNSCQ